MRFEEELMPYAPSFHVHAGCPFEQSLQFYSQGDRILLLIVAYWSIVVMEKQEINDNAIIDKGDKSERKVYS